MAATPPDESQPGKSPQRVGVREFRGNLTGFLRQARQGRSFLIMSRDQVLAEVGPPSHTARPHRQPGALRGKIRIAPDFDALPSDTLAAMEGEEE
jgi:antitoxin (DNA-binding transcriptional repressor) of toxin-antitoxin stability system